MKKSRKTRTTPKQWADLGSRVLSTWKAAFAAPAWSLQLATVDSEKILSSVGDGGRSLSYAGLHNQLGLELSADITEAEGLLADRVLTELLGRKRVSVDAKQFLELVSTDVATGVLGELCLSGTHEGQSPWIPTFSRALDAWGHGLGLGMGTDDDGSWGVMKLDFASTPRFGRSCIENRLAAVPDDVRVAIESVRQLMIETADMSEASLDLMDVVRGIAQGTTSRKK